MKLRRLLLRELAYRKVGFVAGVLAVAAAGACCVGTVLLLRSFDLGTEQVLHDKREVSRQAWAHFKDEMRKDMLRLGFNLMILDKDQNLSNPDADAKYLPQAYADRLAAGKLAVINHVLPFLQQKVWWSERNRWITLVGTTGEVLIQDPARQKPMFQTVPKGQAVVGYAIHRSLNLSPGDTVTLDGREFPIAQCLPQKGFEEDEMVYVPLAAAQEILKQPERITGILAVNCLCEGPEGLLTIRKEVEALLPDTRVIEHNTKLVTRAEVRSKAAREADADLAREQTLRGDLRAERVKYGAMLVPLVVLAAAFVLGLLTWENVNRRRLEIGILRALGLRGGQVQALFLGKAALTGILGAVVGYAAALAAAARWFPPPEGWTALLGWILPAACLGGATVLAVAASWVPAQLAGATDPAEVLLKEGG